MRFTPYIKAMQQPNECPEQLFNAVCEALKREMMRKHIWKAPPAILGVPYDDYPSWADKEAFQDLACHCFTEAIVRPFYQLKNALNAGSDNIDRLVELNIEHFLLDLQKKHDPTGYYLALNASSALESLLNKKKIRAKYLVKDKGNRDKVSNKTLIIFSPFTQQHPCSDEQLEQHLSPLINWSTDLPILRRSQINPETENKISSLTMTLGRQVLCFRFGSFMRVLKEGAWRVDNPKNISLNGDSKNDDKDNDPTDEPETLLLIEADTPEDYIGFKELADWIWQRCETDNEQQVWLTIAEYFAQDRESTPKVRWIAEQTGIPKSTVNDAIQKIKTYLLEYWNN